MSVQAEVPAGISKPVVPKPRNWFFSICAGVPDFAIAGFLIFLVSVAARSDLDFEESYGQWKYWYAYEFFSWLGLIPVAIFHVKTIEREKPELRGRVLREPAFWQGLAVVCLIVLALLAKAAYDMGNFRFFWSFLLIYVVRWVAFQLSSHARPVDALVESIPVLLITVFVAFPLGTLFVGDVIGKYYSDWGSHPMKFDQDPLVRLFRILSVGILYYLFQGCFAVLGSRFPTYFTIAGLDSLSSGKVRQKQP